MQNCLRNCQLVNHLILWDLGELAVGWRLRRWRCCFDRCHPGVWYHCWKTKGWREQSGWRNAGCTERNGISQGTVCKSLFPHRCVCLIQCSPLGLSKTRQTAGRRHSVWKELQGSRCICHSAEDRIWTDFWRWFPRFLIFVHKMSCRWCRGFCLGFWKDGFGCKVQRRECEVGSSHGRREEKRRAPKC